MLERVFKLLTKVAHYVDNFLTEQNSPVDAMTILLLVWVVIFIVVVVRVLTAHLK